MKTREFRWPIAKVRSMLLDEVVEDVGMFALSKGDDSYLAGRACGALSALCKLNGITTDGWTKWNRIINYFRTRAHQA